MNTTAICSIASQNYIPFAKTLFQSIKSYHVNVDCFFCLADEITDGEDIESEDFSVIEAKNLGINSFEMLAFRYDIVEFNVSLKPYLLQHLINKGYKKIVYFDADICVFHSLDLIFFALDKSAIVITPHILSPMPSCDELSPSERSFLTDGIYNLGFIAINNSEEAVRFLEWWAVKCAEECYRETETGLFVDQKWIDLVPALFENVHIMRHPGCNMAYWNLHERTFFNGKVNSNYSLIFFHFSGLNIENIGEISKYQNRFSLSNRPDLEGLFTLYKENVIENGYFSAKTCKYAYGFFDNGVQIGLLARRLFESVAIEFPHPFNTQGKSYYLLLKKRRLIENNNIFVFSKADIKTKARIINCVLLILMRIIKIDRYLALMKYLRYVAVLRRQTFLLKKTLCEK